MSDDEPANRGERRKERTRRAMLEAAKEILADGGSTEVSIQHITECADVGFGSFHNHFSSKSELFEEAVAEVLEEHGRQLITWTAAIDDPAEIFATRFRLTTRLATTAPAVASVFVATGMDLVSSERGLAPMALRDIEAAMDAGRFDGGNPHLALIAAAGCLLTFLHLRLTTPHLVAEEEADILTAGLLVMFGMSTKEATRISQRPLPT